MPSGVEFPNPAFPFAAFGVAIGQVTANANPQRLINGLTVSQLIRVYALTANTKDICLGDQNVSPTNSFRLQPGKDATLSTGLSRSKWWVVSQDGTNQDVNYITVAEDTGGM